MKELDGTGVPIADDGDYYVQDTRSVVGNCAVWWRANGAGYACDLSDAGVYKGAAVRSMRDTDVPWPVHHVRPLAIQHVRADVQAMERRDVDALERVRAYHKRNRSR